jgi:hypothetical protein
LFIALAIFGAADVDTLFANLVAISSPTSPGPYVKVYLKPLYNASNNANCISVCNVGSAADNILY